MKQTGSWYAIRARGAAPRSAEVLIYGDIGESWADETVTAANFVREVSALDVDELSIRINSIGGSVPDGIAIYNAIKRHKANATVTIDGMALSIASLIAMAGDTVEMSDNAMMMIHAPWTFAAGNSVAMRETADTLDKWAEAMATSYSAKTGKPVDEMLALLTDGVDHYYTATEALDAGLIDAVVTAMPIAASIGFPAAALARFHSLPHAGIPTAAAAAATQKEHDMKTEEKATENQPLAVDEQKVRAAALAADKQRREDIAMNFKRFEAHEGVAALLAQCQDDHNCTPSAAGEKLLAHLAKDAAPVAGNHVVTVEDEREKFRAAATQSILARAAVKDASGKPIRAESANPYRGHSLLDMARACLARAGLKTNGMDKMQIVAAAFTQSTSDFPVLLETTMHKTLQAAYATAADTWSRFCSVGSVSDFRANPRYRVGSLSNLDALNELGEFKNKSIPDGEKASITAATKGNIINISRQTVINDDLGAFVGLSAALGRAAKRTIEADVYALLALNGGLGPTMSDSLTLFHATHANVGTGAAISMASIDADRVLMGSQKDVGGNDYLDIVPAVLLVPLSLGGSAREVNGAEYNDEANKQQRRPNVVRGLYRDIVDTPRLTGTRRYSFADPATAPVIEVAFLDGNMEPALDIEQGFDVDGSRYRVRLDFGIGAIDYRGAVTNAGA